ncbi:MAG: deoxyguanosinetriphosphate triphosphohydrolase [Sporichthyaceae bacterium]
MDQEAMAPGYTRDDVQRWVPEPPKRPGRTAFARDRARVLHAAAFRRLAAKTQVVAPGTDDFSRNRLTHSLEVGQIGCELAKRLGADSDLVETACLAHDLGHPPFGHNGEDALDLAAAGCGGFEGNAQTLRVLTRLEGKTLAADGRSAGLNLTRATLDATVKYPWPRGAGPAHRARGKFGCYAEDEAVYRWLRFGRPDGQRCLEAEIMDFADDVAYSVHDVEDGTHAGNIDLRVLDSATDRKDLAEVVLEGYLADLDAAELDVAAEALTSQPWWPRRPDRTRSGMATLKNMTSELIGRFSVAAEHATRDGLGEGVLTRYDAHLVVPRETVVEVALLKALADRYVMRTPLRVGVQVRERALIAELVDALDAGAPEVLEPAFREDWVAAPDDLARRRVVVDQVASLTDATAASWHAQLCRS